MVLSLLLLSLGVSIAFHTPQQPVAAAATAPITFTLRIAGERTRFHSGEIIPIELEFTSRIPDRFVLDNATYDRSGRLTIDEFQVDPIDRATDPLLDYFASGAGFIGGGLRGMPVLSETPTVVRLQLNEWFRFDQPGTFRLSAVSRRVTDDAPGQRDPLVLQSNTVAFEIVPIDDDWATTTIAAALRLLDSTPRSSDPREGCRMLRFLATDVAVDEMIARYEDERWGCGFEYMAGLFAAPNRQRVVRQMEAALRRREQPVSRRFLQTLAVLALYVAHPEYRPAQTADNKGRLPAPGELALRHELVDAEIARYRAVMLASLPEKARPARALTLADEFQSERQPTDGLRHQLTLLFLDLPADRQRALLQYSWTQLADPEMLPALRTLVANGPAVNTPFGDIALLRLYRLAPDEGRALMLRSIAVPPRGATLKTLGSLPDAELRELDDRLASNVESASGFEDYSIRAELLHRYASSAVASRVLAAVRDRVDGLACRPKAAILAFFVRVDPRLGARLLDEALAARAETGCYRSVLIDVANLRMSPVLEAAAIAHLTDADAAVVANAAEVLGRYGSPAGRSPLMAAFERWHAVWAERSDDVRPRQTQPRGEIAQSMVEHRLSNALAKGRGWIAGRREVEAIGKLCVTDSCRNSIQGMLMQIDQRAINVSMRDDDEAFVSIAQYQLESVSQLEEKLAQFPVGTRFQLNLTAPVPQIETLVRERILRIARARGIQID